MVVDVARDHPQLVRSLVLAEASITSLVANNEAAKPSLAEIGKTSKAATSWSEQPI